MLLRLDASSSASWLTSARCTSTSLIARRQVASSCCFTGLQLGKQSRSWADMSSAVARNVAVSDCAILTPRYSRTLSSASMRMRLTRWVHRSTTGCPARSRRSLRGDTTGGITALSSKRGVPGLVCRSGTTGVLGREVRLAGVGILRGTTVSVDTSDNVSVDAPTSFLLPGGARISSFRPLGPASRRSRALISSRVLAISSESDSDLVTVTSKCVEVVDVDHNR